MSGHSKWAKTHRQKSAQDAKKGAVFTKLANLITIAAKEAGGDPESNFRLRLAMEKARAANMPKDNIERAISKGAGGGKDGVTFEEVTYEIIGPTNSAFIAEAITDNKNRTVADLKSILNKNGGQLGSVNSVAWNFDRRGIISISNHKLNDESELIIIDAGAEDIIKEDEEWQILTAPENLMAVVKKLQCLNFDIKESSLAYLSKEEINITNQADQEKIEKLYEAIDDLDDIANVYTNAN